NLRQYTAYYHFLNFVAAYPFLEDVDCYLRNLEYVRGQNMQDDFASEFCYRDKFIEALRHLIAQSKSRYVILSYYGGRNHWNHWSKKDKPTDYGLELLTQLFNDRTLFKSSISIPVLQLRQNYQSRVGE